MLIESYRLEIEAGKHSAEEFEYEAVAHLPVDISEALPYLNATLRNGTYFADGPVFSWRQGDHSIGFWPNRIAVDHFETREHAAEMIEQLVKLVNETWEKRTEIEPDTTTRENLQPLELYKLLPKIHCKVCGETTCMNFALKVAAGQKDLKECQPLYSDSAYEEQRKKLETLLATKRPLL
jgi:ArsR family metal-binding transcriptional regulator